MTFPTDEKITYGCEEFGSLTRVMLHRPGEELRIINQENYKQWLFDFVPDVDRFIEEHDRYRELLISQGVEVIELIDYVRANRMLIPQLPNLTYLHDTAVITTKGAFLSAMAMTGRRNEEVVVREALTNLGVPIIVDFDHPEDAFEGCLLLSPDTVLVAETERHNKQAVRKFMKKALTIFREIIYVEVPKIRRYMHPDTIFNRITVSLALAYLPVFKKSYRFTEQGIEKIDFIKYMRTRGIKLIGVSDEEQIRLACTFVPLQPGVIIHYDTALDKETKKLLARKGVEVIFFHPEAILAGGGSLRCLTLRLHRECKT